MQKVPGLGQRKIFWFKSSVQAGRPQLPQNPPGKQLCAGTEVPVPRFRTERGKCLNPSNYSTKIMIECRWMGEGRTRGCSGAGARVEPV